MKERTSRDVDSALSKFLDNRVEHVYRKFYVGKIENNNDPEQLGRCKVRVYGVYDSVIPTEDLPWAIMEPNFIGGKKGSFIVPPIDTIVRVYFENSDIYTPIYTTKIMDKSNLPSGIDEDYPNTMVFFQTDNGDLLKINRKTNVVTFSSASGATIIIDESGNININTKDAGGTINLNGDTYSISRYDKLKILLDKYFGPSGVFTTWVPIPMDGGLALKTALIPILSQFVTDMLAVESSNNKVD